MEKKGVESWIFVIDMAGYRAAPGELSHNKNVIDIFLNQYPEVNQFFKLYFPKIIINKHVFFLVKMKRDCIEFSLSTLLGCSMRFGDWFQLSFQRKPKQKFVFVNLEGNQNHKNYKIKIISLK